MTVMLALARPTVAAAITGFALEITSDVTLRFASGVLISAPMPTYACTVERFTDTATEIAAAIFPIDTATPIGFMPATPSAWTYTSFVTL